MDAIGGLDRQVALDLLVREAREPVPGEVADRLYEATGANPLALLEVAADAAGLVRLHHAVLEFRHPLARAVIYNDALPAERRHAHRALADALPDRDADRLASRRRRRRPGRLRGLGAAASRPARASAPRLRDLRCCLRAGRTADAEATALPIKLLYEAADSAWLAGAVDRVSAGHAVLVAGAELAAAAGEPELGALKLLPATPGMRAEFVCKMAHRLALVLIGDRERGADTIREAFASIDSSPALQQDPSLLASTALGALWLREADGSAVIDRAITEGRMAGGGQRARASPPAGCAS